MNSQSLIDYFKLFKIFDLKKLQKTGQVKLIQDKQLNRKVILVQGNVSANNYITLSTLTQLNIPFNQRYLYIQGFAQHGKNFCIQLAFHLNAKVYKIIYSTLYKAPKQTQSALQYPLKLKSGIWTLLVIDLYDMASNYYESEEVRMTFRLAAVQIRATSKVKGIFQSDTLFTVDKLPKELIFPLKKQEDYFETYDYVFTGSKDENMQFEKEQKKIKVQKSQQKRNSAQKALKDAKNSLNKNINKSLSKKDIKQQGNPQSSKMIPEHDTNEIQRSVVSKKGQQLKNNLQLKQSRKASRQHSSRNNSRQKPITKKQIISKNNSTKNQIKKNDFIDMNDEQLHEQAPKSQPKPSTTLDVQLIAVEGISVSEGQITTVGSYMTKPSLIPLHKSVEAIYQHPGTPYIILSYKDGSICYFDTIRKKSLLYFKTQLKSINKMIMDQLQNIICVGLDKMRRQVIMIVSFKNNEPQILFQQVSNFQIQGIKLYNPNDFQSGIITFGYQNIRLWRVKQSVISGFSIYLGQLCRKNTYKDCIVLGKTGLFVDSHGYLTKVSLSSEKMQACNKLEEVGIDKILYLSNNQNQQILTCNVQGTIRIYDQNLTLQTQFMLDQRIKNIVSNFQNHRSLILTYYSKTVCEFNMHESSCSFLLRGHTGPVKSLKYHPALNIITSISEDSTIRMWLFNYKSIKQQFEFRINGHSSESLAMFNKHPYFIIGFDDGIVRKISLQDYKPIGQTKCYGDAVINLQVCSNDKVILSSTYHNASLHDSQMNTLFSYQIHQKKQEDKQFKPLIGFNETSKLFYIQQSYDIVAIYSLNNPTEAFKRIRIPEQKILKIQFIDCFMHILCHSAYYLYENGNLLSVINLNNSNKYIQRQEICLCFPFVCLGWDQKLFLRTIDQSACQRVIMPQNINNIEMYQKQGLIFCSGVQSYSIYAIKYEGRNLPNIQSIGLKHSNLQSKLSINSYLQNKIQNNYYDNEQQQCLPQFGKSELSINQKTILKNKNNSQSQYSNEFLSSNKGVPIYYGRFNNQKQYKQQPSELKKIRSIYQKQQQMLEQCEQLFNGNLINHNHMNDVSFSRHGNFNNTEHLNEDGEYYQEGQNSYSYNNNNQTYNAGNYCNSGQAKLNLIYGVNNITENNKQKDMNTFGYLIWNPQQQYLLLSYQSQLICHYFKRPIRQNIIDLPFKSTSIKSSKQKYIGVSIMANIRLYIKNNTNYFKPLTFPMDYIIDFQFSLCQNYIIAIGTKNNSSSINYTETKQKKSQNILICVMQISSGNIITLSYLKIDFKTQREKKVNISLQINSVTNRPNIQFLIYTYNKVYFYRVSSIMTLQMQELQNIDKIVQKSGNLISATYCSLEDQQMLLFGTKSGSLLIVDARSATILVLCVGVLKTQISKIIKIQNNLALFSANSQNITIYENINNVKDIVKCIQTSPKILTLDSKVLYISNYYKQNNQLIILSGLNTLWLIDFSDFMTIKILSYHNKSITAMKISQKNSQRLLTGGNDGFVRETSLQNLQQEKQIYKPRRSVKDIIQALDMLVVAFDDQLYFYSDDKSLGSCSFKDEVVSVRHISNTTNFIVITISQILVLYIIPNQNAFKLQMHPIAQSSQLFSLQINEFVSFDVFLTTQLPGKINVWTRKCLKRVQDPIVQLSKIHQLQYYLVDTYTTTVQAQASFISKDQYILGQGENALIQIRNFIQHTITRQISFQSSFTRFLLKDDIFYLGDKDGFISIVNSQGFTINKIRVVHRQIEDIKKATDDKLLIRAGVVALLKI